MVIASSGVADLRQLASEFGNVSLTRSDFLGLFKKIGSVIDDTELQWVFDTSCTADVKNGGKIRFADLIDALFDNCTRDVEPEEKFLFYFRKLSVSQQAESVDVVRKLYQHGCAETIFSSLEQGDIELLSELFGACSKIEDNRADALDVEEFQYVHTAVSAIKGRIQGGSTEMDPDEVKAFIRKEFREADLNMRRGVTAPEIYFWLRSIAETLPSISTGELLKQVTTRCLAMREVEKYTMASELQKSLRQYSDTYRKLMSEPNCQPVPSRLPASEDELMQPPVPGRPITYEDLIDQGKEIWQDVKIVGTELFQSIGATFWSMGPLKGRIRSEEKIANDYAGEGRRLLDIVRISVVCDHMNMVHEAIRWMDAQEGLKIIRVKSAFDKNSSFAVRTGGYRDCKLNVQHIASGHLFEVQLHILGFYSLKKEGGHALYKWARQFSVEGITSASDVFGKLNKSLLQEMIVITQEDLTNALAEFGEDSIEVMELRKTVAQLALTADDQKLLHEHVGSLLKQADKRIIGAVTHDLADIYLLGATSRIFPIDESLQLAKKATALIDDMEAKGVELGEGEILFLGKCHAVLGDQLRRKADLKPASQHFRKAISSYRAAVGEEHPATLTYIRDLAAILVEIGDDLDEALELLHRVLKCTDVPGKASRVEMELGNAYEKKGDYDKAAEHLKRSLATRISDLGSTHIAVANAYLPLGRCQAASGKKDEARQSLRSAFNIYEPLLKEAKEDVRGDFLKKSFNEVNALIVELEGVKPQSAVC